MAWSFCLIVKCIFNFVKLRMLQISFFSFYVTNSKFFHLPPWDANRSLQIVAYIFKRLMPLDSPAPRLHINTHTWNWKVSSHLPEAEERRKEWSWQWCRKVRELKVNFPRNRKYPSNTGTHTHTHTQTYSKWQRTATSFCTQYQKKKKKSHF